jgi:hypothetical protein
MSFRRTVEDFTCEHCGSFNRGDGYTNHCTRCLHSKHVDDSPGDRAAGCHGDMAPVDVLLERGRHVLVHRCTRCGIERRCRTSPGDDRDAMDAVVRAKADRFLTGGHDA